MSKEVIRLNQMGYRPQDRKIATFRCDGEYLIIDSKTMETVYKGTASKIFLNDKNSGEDVYVFDFSDFTQEGSYRLEVAHLCRSAIFTISKHPYRDVNRGMLKALYYQRCGMELTPEYAGVFAHKICHHDRALDLQTHTFREVSGGWHDAGDYGRYVNAGINAVAMLDMAYELTPHSLNISFDVPNDSANLPDVLNEIKYEMDFFLKLTNSDGGVNHKVTTWSFGGAVMPENDVGELVICECSMEATATFTAGALMTARVFEPFDPQYAQTLREAAFKAFDWVEKHPDYPGFKNPKNLFTGEYGDTDLRDEVLWATVAMYRETGNDEYAQRAIRIIEANPTLDLVNLTCCCVGGFSAYEVFSMENPNQQLYDLYKAAFIKRCDEFVSIASQEGFGVPLEYKDYTWGSNVTLLYRAVALILGYKYFGNKTYEEVALRSLGYIFGENPTGFSYVTGFGAFPYNYPHHRPSDSDGVEQAIPGLVSGGPNVFKNDTFLEKFLAPDTPPAKCFIDDAASYSGNEITVYWNTAAVFLAAWFDD